MTEAEIMKVLENCSDGTGKSIIQSVIALLNRKNAEIERLTKDRYLYHPVGKIEILPRTDLDKIRAEAIKEFAERVKAFCDEVAKEEWNKKVSPVSWSVAYGGFIEDIDQIAKEMGVEL